MVNLFSETLEQKELRLKRIGLIDLEISNVKNTLTKLESEVRSIVDEDLDYKYYKDNERLFNSLDYEKYCNLLKIYVNGDIKNKELNDKFMNFFKLNEQNHPKNDKEDLSSIGIWNEALKIIKKSLTEITYKTWIESLKFIRMDDSTLILQVDSSFYLGIVKDRYEAIILDALTALTNRKYSVEYIL